MDNFRSLGTTLTLAGAVTANGKPNPDPKAQDYLISNEATAWAYIAFGLTEAAAEAASVVSAVDGGLAGGIPVAPNSSVIIRAKGPADFVSVALAAGTGNVRVTPGEGS